jgi:hypothetical protein
MSLAPYENQAINTVDTEGDVTARVNSSGTSQIQ